MSPSKCSVCDLETTKLGKHYGAITCYPCRAFFRRAKTRKRELRCKKGGNCKLDGSIKKFCPSCRYYRCISVGMSPDFVLDVEGITQRFKFSRSKTQGSDDIDNHSDNSNSSSFMSPSSMSIESSEMSSLVSPSSSSAVVSPITFKTETESFPTSEYCSFPARVPIPMENSSPSSLIPIESPRPSSLNPVDMVLRPQAQPSPVPPTKGLGGIADMVSGQTPLSQSFVRVSVIKSLPKTVKETQESDREKNRQQIEAFVPKYEHDNQRDEFKKEKEFDTLLEKYIHKKFRRTNNSPNQEAPPSIEDIEIEEFVDQNFSLSSLMQMGEYIGLDTMDIDMTFIRDMENTFLSAFREINLGEEVMKGYMDFCVKRYDLVPQFYHNCNLQFREKFLNFVAVYDVINLPYKTLKRVIKKNLMSSQSLIYVFQFNSVSAEEELRLGCGHQDLLQWEQRESGVSGVSFSQMVHHIQTNQETRVSVINCLLQLCMPIMQDLKVFIFTFLLGLFDDDDDEDVVQLRKMFLRLLEKYLRFNLHKYSKIDQMRNVFKILEALPYLSNLVK